MVIMMIIFKNTPFQLVFEKNFELKKIRKKVMQ